MPLKWVLNKWESKECVDLAQGRDRWWALINTAMNVWVPKPEGNCLAS